MNAQKIINYLLKNTCIDIINENEECEISEFFTNKCSINSGSIEENCNFIEKMKDAIKNHLLDTLIDKIIQENGEDLTVIEEGVKYQISSSNNQNNKDYKNISNIKLGECETKLKTIYNITSNLSLLIFKIDIKVEGFSADIVEYEVYHPITKEQLNLQYCDKEQINISIPASLIDKDSIFKYDPNNDFYNDICSTYKSESGTDITLKDRQNDFISENMSLCENNCNYSSYDYELEKVICECNVKIKIGNLYEIIVDTEKLKNKFNVQNLINLKIMKCYTKLFKKEGLITNVWEVI